MKSFFLFHISWSWCLSSPIVRVLAAATQDGHPCFINSLHDHHGRTRLNYRANQIHLGMSSDSQTTSFSTTITTSTVQSWPRETSREIIDQKLFPTSEYVDRMNVGRDSQFQAGDASSFGSIAANDPRLSLTYHEFPLSSMDALISLASLEFKNENGREPNVLVDLGSGCGRLVFYSALLQKSSTEEDCHVALWEEVHGVEISSLMHSYAGRVVERGVELDFFRNDRGDECRPEQTCTNIYFHQGPASQCANVLHKADIIFCYSTVFDTEGFDPEVGTLILAKEWSQMLSEVCKKGTVVVTTDRALNPSYGWALRQSMEVENKSLMGSVGYISVKTTTEMS